METTIGQDYRFGYTPSTIWMDNLYCYGTEARLDVGVPSVTL